MHEKEMRKPTTSRKKEMLRHKTKSIPRGAYYGTCKKYFSPPSLVILLFATPPTEVKLTLQIGGRLLIANHLDKSLGLANEKQGTNSQIILIIALFSDRCTALLYFLVASANYQKYYYEPKQYCLAKLGCFGTFSPSNFDLPLGHILSPAGDHLRFDIAINHIFAFSCYCTDQNMN
jgi:hypothetical protein